MPLTIIEHVNYAAYSTAIDRFSLDVPTRAEYSEERAGGRDAANPSIKRYVAYLDGTIVGWMIVKLREGDLRIEGICTHNLEQMKKGVAKSLLIKAFNTAISNGRGYLTLFDASQGAGTGLYGTFGFEPVDGHGEMRMAVTANFA